MLNFIEITYVNEIQLLVIQPAKMKDSSLDGCSGR